MDGPTLRVAALLAAVRAGAAYLPLDPSYPAERVAVMLADAAPVMLLADAATAGQLPDTGVVPVLVADSAGTVARPDLGGTDLDDTYLDDTDLDDTDLDDADRHGVLLPARPAYVRFTSGATGGPGGAVVP